MVYMDVTNFEINLDKSEKTKELDDLIAHTVSLLNKKGYYTEYCCAGHNKKEEADYDIEEDQIDDVRKNGLYRVVSFENGKYKIRGPILGVCCYIRFIDYIDVPYIPVYFNQDGNDVYHSINFYKDDVTRRSDDEIEAEIILVNRVLYDWAKSLPPIVKDNSNNRVYN